jgi:hypothetical protein
VADDDDLVDALSVVARETGISISTLNRQIASGDGPAVVALSARRKGIRRRDRREWLSRRTRSPGITCPPAGSAKVITDPTASKPKA